VGYAWVVRTLDDKKCFVEEVAVSAELRNNQIGSRLVMEAAKWMDEQGYEEIAIVSFADELQLRRESWFQRMGFKSDGRWFFAAPRTIAKPHASAEGRLNGSTTQ